MSDIAIRCEGLSKLYRIGERERYKTLSGKLTDAIYAPFRKIRYAWQPPQADSPNGKNTIWALRDVSFEVRYGEVVGIIGSNGAGKTTLLKILSRITEPTEGRAEVGGRVGSLLEVGTGFHPELTGRENIYLNGAILGMKKNEIDAKFDEIVAFAEVETFLDTPLKRYSSGMYLRLAFAVAAHMEPEILLVDEVLAVGDLAFQKKCLGKMESIGREGRTVFLVSHNMAAIKHLCQSAILLSSGGMEMHGDVRQVVSSYERAVLGNVVSRYSPGILYEESGDSKPGDFAITRVEMRDEGGELKPTLATWDTVRFRIHYRAPRSISAGSAVFVLTSLEGFQLLLCSTQPDSNMLMNIKSGSGFVDCIFPQWSFAAGRYFVDAALAIPMKEYLCHLREPAALDVQPRDVFSSGKIMPTTSRAVLALPHQWEVSD